MTPAHIWLWSCREFRGPDGGVAARTNSWVVIIEVPSGRVVRSVNTEARVAVASFQPAGRLLAIGTNLAGVDGRSIKIELMDIDSGRQVRYLSGDLPSLGRLVFSPDGKRLAASSAISFSDRRGRVLTWDLTPGRARTRTH